MAGIYTVERLSTLMLASEAGAYWAPINGVNPVNNNRRRAPYLDWPYTTANGAWWNGRNWTNYFAWGPSQFVDPFFRVPFAWGHVYQAADAQNNNVNTSTNTRVNLRNGKTLILRNNGTWVVWNEQPTPSGAYYRWDFAGDQQFSGSVRFENDGTVSVKPSGEFTFHFWHGPKSSVPNPETVRGIVTSVEARLIVDNSSLADDRASARYVAQSGCDLYHSSAYPSASDYPGSATPAIGGGGHGLVANDWRVFSLTSLTRAELDANPPPRFEPEDSGGGGGGGDVVVLPPISRPTTGSWEAKTSGGAANWFAAEPTRTAPAASRRRRPSRFW
jgi:hypothetical protein